MKIILYLIILLIPCLGLASLLDSERSEQGLFSGRVSSINQTAGLIRIKVGFENFKYINYGDRIEFWTEMDPNRKCLASVQMRSEQYMLIKVTDYKDCVRKVAVTTGSYLLMYSSDLENSLMVGKELVKVLLKKRLALDARITKLKRELDIHPNKLEALNKRYEVLRQKLELEWFKELSALEEDKTKSFKDFKQTEARLNDLDHKLQVYKIKDENFTRDRWALDPELYLKK